MSVLRYSTRYPVPEEALRLNEDIAALGRILRDIKSVDVYNCSEDPETGRKLMRYVQGKVKMAESYARRKMQVEFLDPRKKKIQRNSTRVV